MKVLYINSDSGYGSTGRIVNHLYKKVVSEGGEGIICYGRDLLMDDVEVFRIGSSLSVYYHALLTRFFDKQGFGSRKSTYSLINFISSYNPDIIHLHNLHGSYINIKILFNSLKKLNIPVIWTLHDCWAYTGHCSHYSSVGCEKWKNLCYSCPQKRAYPKSFFLDRSKHFYIEKKKIFSGVNNLTITTVSKWLNRQVDNSFLKQYNLKTIGNGIDVNIFTPTKSNIKKKLKINSKYILLGVASVWSNRKGLGLFNELADILNEEYCIILVGVNKKNKKKISERIITIPRTNNTQELVQIYSAADIFINTSTEETFGLVTLEALACGTQIITNSYTANPELADEKCGVIISDLNVKKIKEAILALRSNPKTSEDCVNNAKKYETGLMLNKYYNLYKEVLN